MGSKYIVTVTYLSSATFDLQRDVTITETPVAFCERALRSYGGVYGSTRVTAIHKIEIDGPFSEDTE